METSGSVLRVGVLGPLEIWRDGELLLVPAGRPTRVLLHLVMHAGAFVPTAALVDHLWPSGSGSAASLHSFVSRLRRSLGPHRDVIELVRDRGYRLVIDRRDLPVEIDERAFRALLERARDATPAAKRELLERALSSWRGEPYVELGGEAPVPGHLAELHRLRNACRSRLVAALLEIGAPETAIPLLEAQLETAPDDEAATGQLMRALSLAGRPGEANRVYSDLVSLLRSNYGSSPTAELVDLDGRILRGELTPGQIEPGQIVPGQRLRSVATNPTIGIGAGAELSPFVGREQELTAVESLLIDHRLVVITGIDGCGKSRLAREVLRRRVAEGGAAALAQLADCTADDSESVRRRVVEAVEAVSDTDAQSSPCLLLDNCEHVVDAVALAAIEQLSTFPSLRILATSRLPLYVPGECRHRLDRLEPHAAVDLMRSRLGREIGTEHELSDLCERLDRLPLAIELVAPLVRDLGIDGVPVDLSRSVGRLRDPHRRHPDLAASLEWSLGQLDAGARELLDVVATFAAPAQLDWVRAVSSALGERTDEAALMQLVDRSLVRVEHRRVGMLGSVRAVTRGALESSRSRRLASLHARLVARLGLIEEASLAIQRSIDLDLIEEGLAVLDRFRPELGRIGHLVEIRAWLGRVAADPTIAGRERVVALDLGNTVALLTGEYRGVVAEIRELRKSLDEGHDDRRGRALVPALLRSVLAGHLSLASELEEDLVRWCERHEDSWVDAWRRSGAAFLLRRAGSLADATSECVASIAAFDDLDDPVSALLPRLTLGRIVAAQGEAERACDLLERCTDDAVRLGDSAMATIGLLYSAQVAFDLGDLDRSARSLVRLFTWKRSMPNRLTLASALEHAAAIAAAQGDDRVAARIVGFSTSHRRTDEAAPKSRRLDLIEDLRRRLGDERFERQSLIGRRLSQAEAVELALMGIAPGEQTATATR